MTGWTAHWAAICKKATKKDKEILKLISGVCLKSIKGITMAAVGIPKLLWSLGNSSSVMVVRISAQSIPQNTQVLCWQSSHCDFPSTVPQTIPIKDVMSWHIWQVTITPLMCRQQQQKALIPAYLDFSNRNAVLTPVMAPFPAS